MKILHVNNNFRFLGGTEQYLHGICNELNKLGFENVVMCGSFDKDSHGDSADRTYCIPHLDDIEQCAKIDLQSQIASVVEKEKPDIIYLHNIHNPYVVQELTELSPVVKYVHDHELYCSKGIRIVNETLCSNGLSLRCFVNAFRGNGYRCMGERRLSRIVKKSHQLISNKRVHRKIKKFIVASHHMKDNLISQGYREDAIEVVPYFIEMPEKIPANTDQNNILFVGRVSPEKGLDIFFDILTLLKEDFRFTIVGDGEPDYVAGLQNKMHERGLRDRVKFAGWVDNRNLGRYYEEAAFLAVPSMWPEPFGIVGIEAMAHGRPAIAFDVGGIGDWLENGETGFLIERGDKREFALKMALLFKDKALRGEFGRNARKRAVKLHNKTTHINTLVSILSQFAERKK